MPILLHSITMCNLLHSKYDINKLEHSDRRHPSEDFGKCFHQKLGHGCLHNHYAVGWDWIELLVVINKFDGEHCYLVWISSMKAFWWKQGMYVLDGGKYNFFFYQKTVVKKRKLTHPPSPLILLSSDIWLIIRDCIGWAELRQVVVSLQGPGGSSKRPTLVEKPEFA
eukprot:g32938.t1